MVQKEPLIKLVVTSKVIKTQALHDIAKKKGLASFGASTGWLFKFTKRVGIYDH